MLSDTGRALADAIRDHPADDAPRLIYADWLDEQGEDARAQFIRLQCEEARLDPWDERRSELKRAWRRLLREHARRWREGLPRFVRGEYERGFLKNLHITGAQFRRHIADIWAIEPVADVVLYGSMREVATTLQVPEIAHLRGLRFESLHGRPEELLVALTATPHLTALTTLELNLVSQEACSPATLQAVEAWRLPNLQSLHCFYAPVGPDRHVEPLQLAFLGGKLLATVADVVLLGNRTKAVAEAFANAPTRRVQSLWLQNHDDDVWLDILTHTKRLPALRTLAIDGCDASAKVLREFFQSPLLGRLTALHCQHGRWRDRTTAELVQSPHVRQLQHLQLAGNPDLTDQSAPSIVAAKSALTHLHYLNLVWTGMTVEGVQSIRTALPGCHVAY